MSLPTWLTPPGGSGPREWYRITNADGGDGPVKVYIYDSIGDSWFGGVSAERFAKELRELDDTAEVEFHINSPGGDVYDGLAILNAIRQHPGRTTAVVDGLAASAASFIAMGADELVMAENSELMIHDASGLAWGNAELMRERADRLDRISDNIATVYAKKAGGEAGEWREAMRAETWYGASEAVDAGLADRVLAADPDEVEQAKARFDLAVFAHAGRRHAPTPKTPAAPVGGSTTTQEGSPPVFTDEQLATMRQQLGLATDADPATITAALTEALAEQAQDEPQNANPAAAPSLPEGVVAVEAAVLEELRADAAAGRQARDAQVAAHREALVQAAINDGRIAPARREHWLTALAADDGAAEVLAGLTPGLVPVTEVGHAAADTAPTADDALYESIFGTEA